MIQNRARFFDVVRASPFGGRIGGSQVAGIEHILNHAPDGLRDDHLAYCLATAFHETARTMQPIKEYGRGAGHDYGRPDPTTGKAYYGRGFVQLTWKTNYEKAGRKVMADLVGNPALALNADLAASIMFYGMLEGWFTGKKLSDYFAVGRSDPVGARRIINGTDKADMIAGYFRSFLAAIKAGSEGSVASVPLPPVEPPPMPKPGTLVVDAQPRPRTPAPPVLPVPAKPSGFWARISNLITGA